VKKFQIMSFFLLLIVNLFSFQSGEKLTFNIKYGFISAAEAVMQVEDHTYKDSIKCWKFITTSRTKPFFDHIFKVRDRIDSVVDKEKFISYKFEKKLNEGKYKQHRIHLYYPEQNFSFYLKYSRKKKEFKEKRIDIPDNTQDILSAFYSVRKEDLAVGDTLSYNVTSDGKSVITQVIVHRTQTIKTIFGKIECLVIEPVMVSEAVFKQTGRILIWLTNDDRKIPVKMESKVTFGSFKAYLKKYEGKD
jgi:uncharacterized protein DUF3108